MRLSWRLIFKMKKAMSKFTQIPNVMRILSALAMFSPISPMRIYFNRLRGCQIGNNCWIGDQAFLDVHPQHPDPNNCIIIGNDVAIGPSTKIFTHDTSFWQVSGHKIPIKFVRVEIGDNTWIGPNSFIFNAKIGSHCIIAPHTVVKKDIPDYSIASGNPCKISNLILEE